MRERPVKRVTSRVDIGEDETVWLRARRFPLTRQASRLRKERVRRAMDTSASTLLDRPPGGSASPAVFGDRLVSFSAPVPTEKASYQPALGVLRVTAVFGVAALHIISLGLKGTDPGTPAWWIANFYDVSTRWCVPVFIMISGALLLNPRRSPSVGTFYRKRMHRILIPLVFWSVFYLGWQAYFEGITPRTVLVGLVRGNPYGHLWYLYMIAGLYLITPVLQPFLRGTTRREQIAIIVPLLVAVCAHSLINTFTGGHGKVTVFSQFVPYIPYYLCGSLLMQIVVPSAWLKHLVVGIVGIWLAIALGTGLFFSRVEFYLGSHHCPLVILMSIAVFLLVSGLFGQHRINGGPSWKLLRFLDDRSFGVYLIHPLFMLIVMQLGLHQRYLVPQPLVSIPIISVLVILASLLVTSFFKAIPGLRRVV